MIVKHLNYVWASLMAMTLVVAPARYLDAQTNDAEPSVVISLAKVDEQLADVKYLLKAADMGLFGMMVDGAVDEYTPGLDRSKPIGVFLYINEDSPEEPGVLGFVPVTDIDALLEKVEEAGVDIDADGDRTIITAPDGTEIFIRQKGGYAFFSQNEDNIENLPSNPGAELAKWAGDYNIGAKLYPQRIPESLREQAIEMIEQGFEMQMDQLEDQEPGIAEMQRKNFEMQMKQIKDLIHQTKEVVVGIEADKNAEAIHFDFSIVGTEGSHLAKQSRVAAEAGPSQFGGFLMEDCLFNMVARSKSTKEDAEAAAAMLVNVRQGITKQLENTGELDDAQLEKLEAIMDDFMDAVEATVKDGETDFGAVATLEEGNVNLALAMACGNTRKFESALDKLVDFIQEEAADAPVDLQSKSNAATVNGVSMEMLKITVPEEEDEARQIFGDSIALYYGTSEDTVYLCVGSSPVDLLKKALSKQSSDKNISMQGNLYLTPIMKFAAAMEADETVAQMAEELEDSGKDRIRMSVEFVENGQKVRISVQDGVLKLIGIAAQQFGGGFGGSDF